MTGATIIHRQEARLLPVASHCNTVRCRAKAARALLDAEHVPDSRLQPCSAPYSMRAIICWVYFFTSRANAIQALRCARQNTSLILDSLLLLLPSYRYRTKPLHRT